MQPDDVIAPKDSRHIARILAVQYLFSKLKSENESFTPFEVDSLLQIIEEKKFDRKLYAKIVDGVEHQISEIDEIIVKIAPEWPIDQINPVNLAVLRCSIWEGFLGKITPPKVVINEAIEISKALSAVNDSSFINGVLGNIYKSYNSDNINNKSVESNDNSKRKD